MASITCEPKRLAEALAAVKPAVCRDSAIQALSGVRITANMAGNHLHTTDADVHIMRGFAGERDGMMEVVAPHALLSDAIKLFAKHDQVTLAPAGANYEELIVSNGSRTITLRTLRIEDFPPMPPQGGRVLFTANGAELADTIERASRFVSTDETRPVLCGLQVGWHDRLEMVGCDSYRLGVFALPGEQIVNPSKNREDDSTLIPGRGLLIAAKAMRKVETVAVLASEQWAVVEWPSCTYVIRVTVGQYPNWRQLMPEGFAGEMTVPVEQLTEACQVAVKFLTKNAPARLYANGVVKLHGSTPDVGSFEEVLTGATYKPHLAKGQRFNADFQSELEIGFNPEFLADIAKHYASDTAVLKLISPLRPGLFEDGADRYLLMPIRLNV